MKEKVYIVVGTDIEGERYIDIVHLYKTVAQSVCDNNAVLGELIIIEKELEP